MSRYRPSGSQCGILRCSRPSTSQVAVAMFGYMTDLDTVEEVGTEEIVAKGDDLESLLFHFLDEFLFLFSAEPFFVPKVASQSASQGYMSVQPTTMTLSVL